jgi:hypothetical protein
VASLTAPVPATAPADDPWAGAALRPVPAGETALVFDHEPDLLAGLDPASADHLRRRARAPRRWLDPGPWAPPARPSAFGLLVLDGLLLRTVELDGRHCPELIGAGDLVRPWDQPEALSCLDASARWEVVLPATVAVLDGPFAAVVCRFPAVVANLLGRAVLRSRSLALQGAIAHVRHADHRLLLLLWHLADRWGRVTPAGVHVPLPLKHELLADLAGMRRPTASTALARLQRAGRLDRRRDGTWLLLGPCPTSPG